MPFMIGNAPVRRTLKYLKNCKIIFRENVRIFSISFNWFADHHLGAREFIYWHLAQIRYNNPTVQVVKLPRLTPTPFIKIYLEDAEPLLIDLDCRTRNEIYNFLSNLSSITKTQEELESDAFDPQKNKSIYFGTGCERHCLCEIPGQIPCPNVVPIPKDWCGIMRKEEVVQIPPHIKLWGLRKTANE